MFFSILRIFALFTCICSWILIGCQETTEPEGTMPPILAYFIDVGQGDACLIKTPSGRFYLYDTGKEDIALLTFLSKLEVDTLSAIFISHPDFDHYGALLSIIRKLPVKKIYLPVGSTPNETWIKLLQELDKQGIPQQTLLAGDTLLWNPDIRVRTLWPYSKANYEGNDLSTVLRIEYAAHALLLTGDIEDAGESGILESRVNFDSDLLKVAHHGSRSSNGLPFLNAVKPAYAIISCDSTAYGHPHPEAIADLNFILGDSSRILRTDRLGSIGFSMDNEGVHRLDLNPILKNP